MTRSWIPFLRSQYFRVVVRGRREGKDDISSPFQFQTHSDYTKLKHIEKGTELTGLGGR